MLGRVQPASRTTRVSFPHPSRRLRRFLDPGRGFGGTDRGIHAPVLCRRDGRNVRLKSCQDSGDAARGRSCQPSWLNGAPATPVRHRTGSRGFPAREDGNWSEKIPPRDLGLGGEADRFPGTAFIGSGLQNEDSPTRLRVSSPLRFGWSPRAAREAKQLSLITSRARGFRGERRHRYSKLGSRVNRITGLFSGHCPSN